MSGNMVDSYISTLEKRICRQIPGKFKICMSILGVKESITEAKVCETFPRYSMLTKIALLGYEHW